MLLSIVMLLLTQAHKKFCKAVYTLYGMVILQTHLSTYIKTQHHRIIVRKRYILIDNIHVIRLHQQYVPNSLNLVIEIVQYIKRIDKKYGYH
jgi:hypothetical protein